MAAQPSELSARLGDIFGNPATADPTKLYGNLTVNPNGTIQIGSPGLVLSDGYLVQNTPMGRNKIINGDCKIAQRVSLVCTTGVQGFGGPDRYWASNNTSGGSFTQSQGTMTIGGVTKNAVVQTVNTAWSTFTGTNYWSGISQRIEGFNAFDMLGQPAALSFWFNTNVAGTYSVCLEDGTQANTYVTTFTATTGVQKITIQIPALPTSLAIPNSTAIGMWLWVGFINTASYVTATTNAWTTGNLLTTAACTNWAATAGNFIAMTDIQLETGYNATPFERLLIGDQAKNCLRYYEVLTGGQYAVGAVNGPTLAYLQMSWTTVKRTIPSISGTPASTYYIYSPAAGNVATTSWTPTSITQSKSLVTANVASGLTGGQGCLLEDAGSSAVYISAEL